ncbi:MAG TPA: porin [Methylibium sp.]|uniref:porin n=1 Tax=Methylibium sp. TaxID=2067992 RepID=UPI002DBDEA99|nr:porin [Methylibium sp.]HEU4459651.1 porin [Methylibium sp.]
MRKILFALSALAGACAALPAAAQSTVQIYGTVDAAVGVIETLAPPTSLAPAGPGAARVVTIKGVHSGAVQTSFWGLRGTEDLGNGMKARFVLEAFFRTDTGAPGRFDANPGSGADYFFGRNAYVALGSDKLGEVKLGNTPHPTWISLIQTNAFGPNSLFSPSFRVLFAGGSKSPNGVEADTSLVNSAQYSSPVLAGFSANAALQAGEGSGSRYSYSFNLNYRAGPLFVTVANTSLRHAALPQLPGARQQDTWLAGVAYTIDPVRLFGQYADIDNDRIGYDDEFVTVGTAATFGANTFQLAHAQDKQDPRAPGAATRTRETTSAGFLHAMSKRTELYLMLMRDKVWVPAAADYQNADSYVAGIRHQF